MSIGGNLNIFKYRFQLVKKLVSFFVIFIFVFQYTPQVNFNDSEKLTFDKPVKEAKAFNPTETIIITDTATTTWVVPNDWNSASNTMEAIGAGGDGGLLVANDYAGAGGGGGEYRKSANVFLIPGSTVAVNVSSGGAGSSADGSLVKNSDGNVVLEAKNGGNASNASTGSGGTGGTGDAANYDGGDGGSTGAVNTTYGSGGGGGGSAGPSGVGKQGGLGWDGASGGGGGGGSNGGSSSVGSAYNGTLGGDGGEGNDGTGGGAGGEDNNVNSPGDNGTNGGGGGGGGRAAGGTNAGGGDGGTEDVWGTGIGPGGGGGGGGGASGSAASGDKDGGAGGTYGGGGGGCGMSGTEDAGECDGTGVGGQGIIVIKYTPLDAASTWNSSDWTDYDKITVDSTQVDSTLTDFPVYVNLNDLSPDFWNTVATSGADIRVTTDGGSPSELPHELVSIDKARQTGELHFKANSISSSADTSFRIYYNGTNTAVYARDDTYGRENVWTNDYVAVWHMNEDPSGIVRDSTSNRNDATPGGSMTSDDLDDYEKVGNAIRFDGTDDHLTTNTSVDVNDEITICSWVNINGFSPTGLDQEIIVRAYGPSNVESDFTFEFNSPPRDGGIHKGLYFEVENDVNVMGYTGTSSVIDLDEWNYLCAAYSNSAGGDIYVNADSKASTSSDETNLGTSTNESPVIGGRSDSATDALDGMIGDLRISSTSRSAAWISAAYTNQNIATDFYSVDYVKEWNASDWTDYDRITIDADKVDDDLTDFPVYIDLSDLSTDFWNNVNSTGGDIRVMTEDLSIELPREVVSISTGSDTGELHFKAPSVSSTTNTSFRIYYNGTTTPDYPTSHRYGVQQVWSNGYIGVWHLGEDGNTDADGYRDSTLYKNDATGFSMTGSSDVVGKLGTGQDFDGTNYLEIDNLLGEPNNITLTTWAEVDATDTNGAEFVSIGDSYLIRQRAQTINAVNAAYRHTGTSWYDINTGVSILGDPWTYVAYSADNFNDVQTVYSRGVSGVYSSSSPGTEDAAFDRFDTTRFASHPVGDGNWDLNGRLDEVRIASIPRDESWLNAEYENQNDTTGFYSVNRDDAKVWNSSDWSSYDVITIDADMVSSGLTDFPVYIDLSDLSDTFWSTTDSNYPGVDIRVTTDEETPTELPRELVSASSTAQTGELHFKANSISATTDTSFRIYYNGTTSLDYERADTYGSENVWDANFLGVWHLEEIGNNATYGYKDSTSNHYHATGNSMASTSDVFAKMGVGQDFNASNSIDVASLFGEPSDVSVEAWVDADTDGTVNGSHFVTIGDRFNVQQHLANLYTGFAYRNATAWVQIDSGHVSLNKDGWSHVAAVLNDTSNQQYAYVNGTDNIGSLTDTSSIVYNSTDFTRFGKPTTNAAGWELDGRMDEIRISNTARSRSWIIASYENQADPSGFYSITKSDVSWNDTDWTNYETISIDPDYIYEELTEFPVYVDLSDLSNEFWSGVSSDGGDIRVTTDDASPTEVPREVVSIDTGAETGEMHFRADTVSSTDETTFRIYYNGNDAVDYDENDRYGDENVWSNNYLGVWHLDDDPTGTIYDSSANDLDGVSTGSMVSGDVNTSSKIGSGLTFDGTNQMIDLGDENILDEFETASFSIWSYRTTDNSNSTNHNIDNVFFAQSSNGSNDSFEFGTDGFNYEIYIDSIVNDQDASFLSDVSNDEWFYSYLTYATSSATEALVYKDGSLVVATSTWSDETDDTVFSHLSIGGARPEVDLWGEFIGTLDEARISSVTRSGAWIYAEHNNQNSPDNFYKVNGGEPIAWNNNSWTNYDEIVINPAFVDSTLTDFPVYVDLSDMSSSFWNNVSSDGGDIRITTDDASPAEVPREIVSFDKNNNTGEMHFKADSISSSDHTVFRVYYNGTTTFDYTPSDTYGAENVWTNNYVAVWHLDEGDSYITDFYRDSTSGGYHGTLTDNDADTKQNNDKSEGAYTYARDGIDFDGDADYISTNLSWSTAKSDVTVSVWNKVETAEMQNSNLFGGVNAGERFSAHAPWSTSAIIWDYGDITNGRVTTDYDNHLDEWTYINFVYATSPSTFRAIYTNDKVLVSDTNADEPTATISNFAIGSASGLSNYHQGDVDELRVSDTARSEDWIKAEYKNQKNPEAFYSVGNSQNEWNPTYWTEYETITIDASNIDATLTDFPVYVDLSDLSIDFWNGVSSDGGDIRIMSNDLSQEMPREVVSINTTTDTGQLHFEADTINSSSDTVFRIYYNGSTTADYPENHAYGSQSVWANGFIGVWHMEEDGNTTTGGYDDATGHKNDATGVSMTSASDVSSKIGTGQDFDGSVDYLNIDNAVDDYDTSQGTYSAWVNAPSSELDGSPDTFVEFGDSTGFADANGLRILSVDHYSLKYEESTNATFASTSNSSNYTDKWSHMTGTWASDLTNDFYMDGDLLDGNVSRSANISPELINQAFIAVDAENTKDLYIDGSIDEVRVAVVDRSAAWVKAEHINQSTTTDFYSTGVGVPDFLHIYDHDSGQVSNNVNESTDVNKVVYSFKMSSSTSAITVDELNFSLEGVRGLSNSNFTDFEIYIDEDNDTNYDSGLDSLVVSGTHNITGQSGEVSFTTDFTVSGPKNYLLVADTSSFSPGDSFSIKLRPGDISPLYMTASGTVSSVQHSRPSPGGGSFFGAGENSEIGGAPGGNDGAVSGGGESGGSDSEVGGGSGGNDGTTSGGGGGGGGAI